MIKPAFASPSIFNAAYDKFMRTQKRYQHLMGSGGSGKSIVAAQKVLFKYMLAPQSEQLWIDAQILKYGDKLFAQMVKEERLIIPNEWHDRMKNRYGHDRYNQLIASGELVQPIHYRDWKEYIYLLREQQNSVRDAQFSDIKNAIYRYKLQDYVESIQDSILTIRFKNGNILKCAGLRGDGVDRLKSISDITGFWVEEVTNTSLNPDGLNQLSLRLRTNACKDPRIILTYNPIHESHWINRNIWLQKEIDSNNPITPQEIEHQKKNVFKLKTTYKDNRFLPQQWIDDLELTKYTNPNHYRVYALGEWGGDSKGCVYPYPERVDKFPDIIDRFCMGIDIGYEHPFTVVKVGVVKEDVYRTDKVLNEKGEIEEISTQIAAKGVYMQEVVYVKKRTPYSILHEPITKDVNDKKNYGKYFTDRMPKDLVYYIDHSRPDVTEEFRKAGYNVRNANKSVEEGIEALRKLPIYVVQNEENNSMNLLAEFMGYKYVYDKKLGIYTDKVEKEHDDCLDAARYAYYTGFVKQSGGSLLDIMSVGKNLR